MEQTKERSRWAGRLEVVLVMAAIWLFGFSTSFIRFGYWTGQILRFCLLAVLPCVVLLPHPFAYMGFTRKRIGKQLLLGLLTALILYPVCLAAEYVFLQPLVPEGYRMTFRLITQGQSISWIAADAIHIFFSSFPEEIIFRGYFQNRLSFFTSSKPARVVIQAVLFGLIILSIISPIRFRWNHYSRLAARRFLVLWLAGFTITKGIRDIPFSRP